VAVPVWYTNLGSHSTGSKIRLNQPKVVVKTASENERREEEYSKLPPKPPGFIRIHFPDGTYTDTKSVEEVLKLEQAWSRSMQRLYKIAVPAGATLNERVIDRPIEFLFSSFERALRLADETGVDRTLINEMTRREADKDPQNTQAEFNAVVLQAVDAGLTLESFDALFDEMTEKGVIKPTGCSGEFMRTSVRLAENGSVIQ
jgi:hypothetical protein